MVWETCTPATPPVVRALVGIPTVTALRATPGVAEDVVALLDYNGSTPGSQGVFQWDPVAAPDDGVTRFNAGAANVAGWRRVYDGPIDVKWAGAVGNGIVDDTVAIQRAIAAADTLGGGLFFSKTAASYLITDALVLANPIHITSDRAKITQSGVAKNGFHVTAANVIIEDLYLYNSRGGLDWIDGVATNAVGINLIGADNAIVQNCKIENWGCVGIRVGFTSKGGLLTGNEIIGIGVAGGLFVGANTNSGIYANLTGDVAADSGIRIENNRIRQLAQGIVTGTDQANIIISGNQITEIIGQHGIYAGNAVTMTIQGNSIRNTGLTGIKVAFSPDNIVQAKAIAIVGNVTDTTGSAGIDIGDNPLNGQRMKGIAVTGNSVSNTSADGIYVNACDDFVVADNIVHTTAEFGIRLAVLAQNGIVSGNMVIESVKSGLYAVLNAAGQRVIVENNYFRSCAGAVGTVVERSSVVLGGAGFTFRHNRVDYAGAIPGTYANTLVVDAAATVDEYENYLVVGAKVPSIDPGATFNTAGENFQKSFNGRTNVGITTLLPRTDAITQVWTAGATAVTVQFDTASAVKGDRFRIIKDYTTGGTLTINLVSGSRTFTSDTRGAAEVTYNGTAWIMTSFSSPMNAPALFNSRSDVGVITLDLRAGDAIEQVWTAAASAVTVQFATSSAVAGDKFRIVKDYTSGGALTINLVSGARTFLAGERGAMSVVFNGTVWIADDYTNLNQPNSIGNGPLEFIAAATGPGIKQDTAASDVAPLDLVITPQAPFATATGTNRNPTNVIAALAVPTNGGATEGQLRATRGGNFVGAIGPYPAAATVYGCLWLGYNIAANSGAGSAVFSDGTANTYLNVPAGSGSRVGFTVSGADLFVCDASVAACTPSTFNWIQAASPTIQQAQRTGDNPAANMTLTAQAASAAATGANENGGNVILTGGTRDGVGNQGGIQLRVGGGTVVVDIGASGTTSQLAFFAGTRRAKQTITGALSTVIDPAAKAVLTSIIAALSDAAGYSLVTDSTT